MRPARQTIRRSFAVNRKTSIQRREMEYKPLGHSGMKVSRIIVGCMGFGDPSRGTQEWALGIDEARPIMKQTLEALYDLVKSGKVRYIGASSMYAWQFAQAQYVADLHGWTRFVSMQDQYNLLMREEEREMLPFCLDQRVGVIPWSPLARGLLTREWSSQTKRSEIDKFTKALYSQAEEANHQIVETVKAIAEERHVPMAQIGLAWLLQKEAVTAPIVGVTKPQHLTDAVAAVNLKLSDEEIRRREAPYLPQLPVAFESQSL